MKYLWLLTQSESQGYDTFDSCVVIAESEEVAKTILPAEMVLCVHHLTLVN